MREKDDDGYVGGHRLSSSQPPTTTATVQTLLLSDALEDLCLRLHNRISHSLTSSRRSQLSMPRTPRTVLEADPALQVAAPAQPSRKPVSVNQSSAADRLQDLRSLVRRQASGPLNDVLHGQVDRDRSDHCGHGLLTLEPGLHQRLEDVADRRAALGAALFEPGPQLGIRFERSHKLASAVL